jgi:antitoxin MazE
MTSTVITKWGNSLALRIPSALIKKMDLECEDKVYMEVNEDRIIISKAPAPKKGTLEYLFKDYSTEPFKTTLINPIKPVGNEKW